MGYTKEEEEKILAESYKILESRSKDGSYEDTFKKISTYFYTPDRRLPIFLNRLREEITKRENEEPDALTNSDIGKLMEQIAYLSFCGLSGHSEIKSFQSAGPQYDLIISGDTDQWERICKFLFIDASTDFLVEVKAEKRKIGDPQFARLCSLLEFNLPYTSRLGILFTLKGATGFPDRADRQRQRSIKDARFRQVIFMASCGKPIVVFDLQDILALTEAGSLIQTLRDKIRDIEQLSGLAVGPPVETPAQCDLPPHLLELN